MECVPFLAWLFSGVGVVAVLEWLKHLPKIGTVIEANGALLAALLTVLAPFVAQEVLPYCSVINPSLWLVVFYLGTFILEQISYKLGRATGVIPEVVNY